MKERKILNINENVRTADSQGQFPVFRDVLSGENLSGFEPGTTLLLNFRGVDQRIDTPIELDMLHIMPDRRIFANASYYVNELSWTHALSYKTFMKIVTKIFMESKDQTFEFVDGPLEGDDGNYFYFGMAIANGYLTEIEYAARTRVKTELQPLFDHIEELDKMTQSRFNI